MCSWKEGTVYRGLEGHTEYCQDWQKKRERTAKGCLETELRPGREFQLHLKH